MLSPTAAPWSMDKLLPELREKLQHFDDGDYLLLVGNPALIGVVVAVASEYNGKIQMLQWHGREKRYIPIVADLDS